MDGFGNVTELAIFSNEGNDRRHTAVLAQLTDCALLTGETERVVMSFAWTVILGTAAFFFFLDISSRNHNSLIILALI